MNAHRLYARVSPLFRRRRMQRFASLCAVDGETWVLDVGGTWFNWTLLPRRPPLVLVNLAVPRQRVPGVHYVVADSRALPFRNMAFPIVFSNSVIEHVGTWDDQASFASEIARVGASYFVQAPNRWFPIEPHLITVGIHWLPKRWRRRLRLLSLRGWISSTDYLRLADEVRLPTTREFRRLFPDATVTGERWLGLRKSLIATRTADTPTETRSGRDKFPRRGGRWLRLSALRFPDQGGAGDE